MTLLLDTTVLVYAAGDPSHPLAGPARSIVNDTALQSGFATTTPEVLQEFLHVWSRRRSRESARDYVVRFANLLTPLVATTEQHLRDGADIFASHDRVGAFDSVLAAVAMADERLELVSADQAYHDVVALPFRELSTF